MLQYQYNCQYCTKRAFTCRRTALDSGGGAESACRRLRRRRVAGWSWTPAHDFHKYNKHKRASEQASKQAPGANEQAEKRRPSQHTLTATSILPGGPCISCLSGQVCTRNRAMFGSGRQSTQTKQNPGTGRLLLLSLSAVFFG